MNTCFQTKPFLNQKLNKMSRSKNHSFKAAIIDMDGVITQTARLHAKAWKQMFDPFLKRKEGGDYDGTLTPIVQEPDAAVLSDRSGKF
jgi:hypothetical protein